ncbi:MAG: hypothetical protein ABRQ25_10775 [Clostridiaceae bacterium]
MEKLKKLAWEIFIKQVEDIGKVIFEVKNPGYLCLAVKSGGMREYKVMRNGLYSLKALKF